MPLSVKQTLGWEGNPDFTLAPDYWGTRADACTALTYAYRGGPAWQSGGVRTVIADGTLALTDNTTNYVERYWDGSSVRATTTGFTGGGWKRMAVVVTSGGAITDASMVDHRFIGGEGLDYAPASVEAGITDTTYPPLHLHRYGATGDLVADDGFALRAACVALQAAGGGTIRGIPGKKYLIYSPTADNGVGTLTITGGNTGAFSVAQTLAAAPAGAGDFLNLNGTLYNLSVKTSNQIYTIDGSPPNGVYTGGTGATGWRYVRPSIYGFSGVKVAFEDMALVVNAAQSWSLADSGSKIGFMFAFSGCQGPTFRRCTLSGPTVDTAVDTTTDPNFKGRYFSTLYGANRSVLFDDSTINNCLAITICDTTTVAAPLAGRTDAITFRNTNATNVVYGIQALQNCNGVFWEGNCKIDDTHRAFVLEDVPLVRGRLECINNKANSNFASCVGTLDLTYVDKTSTTAVAAYDKIRLSMKGTVPIATKGCKLTFDVDYTRVGTGTVSCTAGAANFSPSQAGILANGCTVAVGGVNYTLSAFTGSAGTLSGSPTFAASAFTYTLTGAGGPLLSVRKYDAGGTNPLFVDVGHVIDGLILSGRVTGAPVGATEPYVIQMVRSAVWGQTPTAGVYDKFSNVVFRDLTLAAGALLDWTTDCNLDALVLDNVDAGAYPIRIRTGFGDYFAPPTKGSLVLRNVTCSNLDAIAGGCYPLRTRLLPPGTAAYDDATTANPRTFTAFDLGAAHSSAGRTDGGAVVHTLPAATVGATLSYIRMHASSAYQIKPATGEIIRGGAANDVLQLQAVGNGCTLLCQAAGTWEINIRAGTLWNATTSVNWPT